MSILFKAHFVFMNYYDAVLDYCTARKQTI